MRPLPAKLRALRPRRPVSVIVAVAMALALAHALELPGKMRLGQEAYYVMQLIYHQGFTIGGGLGEFGGMISTTVLLLLTPWPSADFGLTLLARWGLIGMQAIYWFRTHPVNTSRHESRVLLRRFGAIGPDPDTQS